MGRLPVEGEESPVLSRQAARKLEREEAKAKAKRQAEADEDMAAIGKAKTAAAAKAKKAGGQLGVMSSASNMAATMASSAPPRRISSNRPMAARRRSVSPAISPENVKKIEEIMAGPNAPTDPKAVLALCASFADRPRVPIAAGGDDGRAGRGYGGKGRNAVAPAAGHKEMTATKGNDGYGDTTQGDEEEEAKPAAVKAANDKPKPKPKKPATLAEAKRVHVEPTYEPEYSDIRGS